MFGIRKSSKEGHALSPFLHPKEAKNKKLLYIFFRLFYYMNDPNVLFQDIGRQNMPK